MIEELEVGGGDLSVPPTLSSEREASFDYPTCSWTNSNGDTLEVIYIGVMEERHLVLMPGVAWHRKPAQRKFTEVLSKPTTVQLPCAAVNNREEMLEDTMKGWLGYVTDEVAAELEPVDGVDAREAINFRFGLGEDAGYLPHVTALAELAMKHYGFVSAESAVDGEGTGAQRPPVQGRDAGSAPAGAMVASEVGLQERVGNLEKTMTDMAANLQLVLNHLSPPAEPPTVERRVTIDPKPKRISASGAALSSGSGATAKSSSRPSALRKSPSTSFPSLDPALVAAATAAGIPQETLQEMEKLILVDLAGAKRLKEASMSKIKAAPPRKGVAGVLSESEDEETEAEGSGVDSSGNPMEASLQKLTEVVGILAMDKKKKAKASKMEQALDGISAGSGSDASLAGGCTTCFASGIGGPSCRSEWDVGAAADGRPDQSGSRSWDARSFVLCEGMAGASQPDRCISHLGTLCLVHCWRLGRPLLWPDSSCPSSGRVATFDAGSNSNRQRTMAFFIRALYMEQGPPLASLGAHVPPSVSEGESPFSRLLDSRWAEISMAYLRDTEDFISKRRGLGKRIDDTEKDKEKPKAKAKTKGKPSESQGDA